MRKKTLLRLSRSKGRFRGHRVQNVIFQSQINTVIFLGLKEMFQPQWTCKGICEFFSSCYFHLFCYFNNIVDIKVSFPYACVACITVLLNFRWIFPSYSEMTKYRLSYNTACKKSTISFSDSWIRTFLLLRYKFAALHT